MRLPSMPACRGATWRSSAPSPAISARPVRRSPSTTCGRRSAAMPGWRGRSSRCSAAGSTPARSTRTEAKRKIAEIETALEGVESLDEDRIIRRFLNVVDAIVRTNFFQPGPDGAPRAEIVLKLDPKRVEELPAPRPFREIFVYSPRVEGVHLRFGPVARGGIRWSDRPLDFRTEVLGLAKAQQVKNAVIVPVGAKGGFVPKRLPAAADRERGRDRGPGGLRDLHRPPARHHRQSRRRPRRSRRTDVVRRDGDDPYLVVAADKGTATFSDTANAIAEAHGFWLGDAFASGGSHGYDHKKMGITARGAWVAVERHFREMNVDIQTTPFTVVGVGDMSGDVFGNAMLLSPATKLVAAFDHRDIFIDPDPDPAASLAERRRLFELPRSSWQDYDRAADLAGRRRVLAARQGDPAQPRDAGAARPLGRARDAERGAPRHPQGARRPPLLRRHRHLRPRRDRRRRSRRRPRQRRGPHHRGRAPRPRRRRGRQPRHDPARARRLLPQRRALQLGRHRQLRRRQHLRRRGQHQDRARPRGARRPARHEAARPAARRHDRRGRRPRAPQQLPADARHLARREPRLRVFRASRAA